MENKYEIEELITALNKNLNITDNEIKEIKTEIADSLFGLEIEHKVFGKGKILSENNSIIEVEFNDKLIKKFKIPDAIVNKFIILDGNIQEKIDKLIYLNNKKTDILTKLSTYKKNLDELNNIRKFESDSIICKEARQCVEQGYISIDDKVEFRTIRDVSDLFNKNYTGFQRSWIKVDSDWQRVASCFQMTSASDRNIYKNVLTADGSCFYFYVDEDSDVKKENAVIGCINHEMKITFLFLKFPNANGYKFVGVFEKDIEAMKKSIENKEYKVIYKKIDDKLDLTQFFK